MQLQTPYKVFPGVLSSIKCKEILEIGNEQFKKETLNATTALGSDKKQRSSEITWLNNDKIYDLLFPYIAEANKCCGWLFQWDRAELIQFTRYEGKKKQHYDWHTDGPSDWPGMYKPAFEVAKGSFKPLMMKNNNPILDKDGNFQPDLSRYDLKTFENGFLKDNFTVDKEKWGMVRKISMTVSLSDGNDFEGGNFHINYGDKDIRINNVREQGSIVVFPSFLRHKVEPVTKGTRYSLVMWALGKPFQ